MKSPVWLSFGFLVFLSLSARAQPAPPNFFFQDGDRVVFLGDSITQQQQYTTLVEAYILSRFPRWNIRFRNAGWSSDTMNLRMRGGLEVGLKRDVLPLAPTAVTIDFGMNDARPTGLSPEIYAQNAAQLAQKLRESGARVAFLTSSAEEKYEADQPAGSAYNTRLRSYGEALQAVARQQNAPFVDQLNPMIQNIEAGRQGGVLSNAPGGVRLIPDAIHPNWAGHLVMATHILKGLNAAQLVSRVELDARTGKSRCDGCEITQVLLGPVVSFSRLDESLPWPLHPESLPALKIPNFDPLNDLSRFDLQVSSLPAPFYDVAIDGQKIGTFSREDLAYGLNLTQNAGPINEQGQVLLQKIIDKNKLFFTRWREVEVAQFPAWIPKDAIEAAKPGELARLDALINAAEDEIKRLRQPKPRLWTLSPAAI